jgi:AcrR family transcriptional regulator
MAEPLRLAAHPDVERLLAPRADSQRARLLVAINAVAGRRGINEVTVSDVVREAGVSRTTFYERFRSKEDCLIESYRYSTDVLLALCDAAVRQALGTWRDGLRAGARAQLVALSASPEFARATLLEIQNVGERGHAERNMALRRFADAYRQLFAFAAAQQPGLTVPQPDALYVLVAGQDQLTCTHIRDGRTAQLLELEDTLVLTATATLLGTDPVDPRGS